MSQPVERARELIESILCAAVVACPLDQGLTIEEVKSVALAHQVGIGAFDAAIAGMYEIERDASKRLLADTKFWSEMKLAGFVRVPRNIRPSAVLDALAKVFDDLENQTGPREPQELVVLRSHLPSVATKDVDLALGVLVSWGFLVRKGGGFVRTQDWPKYDIPTDDHGFQSKRTADVVAVLPSVVDVFARRAGGHIADEPPIERFGSFLQKQGWTALATWWAMTATEMRTLLEARHPSAVCTLSAALLEAALVAIAHPALQAGEWRNQFLKRPPETWKLGELIEQAESAGTFSQAQSALAREMADLRNRIHAGGFSTAGTPPFIPPYSNAHEARQSRDHLDRLLDALLGWPTVQALA